MLSLSSSSSDGGHRLYNHSGTDEDFLEEDNVYLGQQTFWSNEASVDVAHDEEYPNDQDSFQQQVGAGLYGGEAGLNHHSDFSPSREVQFDSTGTDSKQPDEEENPLLAAEVIDDFAPYGKLFPLPLKRANMKGWKMPGTPTPRRLCYIIPEDAEGERYKLPDGNINWRESGGRLCAEWSRDDIDPNDVIEKLENAPLVSRDQKRKKGKGTRAGEKRTLNDKFKNAWSMRGRRWLQEQGGLAVLKVGSSREDHIPELYVKGLLRLPTASLFHGVNAVVEPGSFEMYPSADYHHGIPADPNTKYPLPVPKDVLPSIRRALLDSGRDLGTFMDFLRRNPNRFHHYKLDPETGKRLIDGQQVQVETTTVVKSKTTRATKAAKTRAKTKAAASNIKRGSKKQAALAQASVERTEAARSDHVQQQFAQPREDHQVRKLSFDGGSEMRPSKKQRTIDFPDRNDGLPQSAGANVPSSCHVIPEPKWRSRDPSVMTEMRVDHNAPTPQLHGNSSPTSMHLGQVEQLPNVEQSFGWQAANSGLGQSLIANDSAYESNSFPATPEVFHESGHELNLIYQSVAMPHHTMTTSTMATDQTPRYSYVEQPNTLAAVSEPGAGWYNGYSHLVAPGAATTLESNSLRHLVQNWLDECMPDVDEVLSFGTSRELDLSLEFNDWTFLDCGWTQ